MRFLLVVASVALAFAAAGCTKEVHSNISPDEQVVFFNTTAWLDAASGQWHVPIHGWIYEPADSSARRALFEKVLSEKYDLAPDDGTEGNFGRRLNLIIADNERAKQIVVEIAGRIVALPLSEENGQFRTTVLFAAEQIESHAQEGILTYSAVTHGNESRSFTGEVRLVGPTGLSVVSDIDDTVKITRVTDRRGMLESTFLLDFEAAPGMSDLYRSWDGDDVSFHYVSSSPWQLYTPLDEFLADAGFPWASLNLKPIRFRDETLLDLFKKGTETKPVVIESILSAYPGRQFVLVGDSGEQDPEVYAGLIRKHPGQVKKIYIRNVTADAPDGERFSRVFDGIDPGKWVLFEDPAGLSLP